MRIPCIYQAPRVDAAHVRMRMGTCTRIAELVQFLKGKEQSCGTFLSLYFLLCAAVGVSL